MEDVMELVSELVSELSKDLATIEVVGLSGWPLAAAASVTIGVLLLVYAGTSGARRRRALEKLMPGLGFRQIEEPDEDELVPEDLFHPNRFMSVALPWQVSRDPQPPPHGPSYRTPDLDEGEQELADAYASMFPRVTMAWFGRLAGREVVVMDVSIRRFHINPTGERFERTVIRVAPPVMPGSDPPPPPDLMILECPLIKRWIRGARAIGGPAQMGRHYHLFSDAPDEALAPWITSALRERLARHRLWRIAAHDGVFFLTRNAAHQRSGGMPSFLAEGEDLVGGLLAAVRHG